GERIDTHCAAMIHILQQLGADVPTQAAALLAYMPEEVGEIAQREKLQAAFGTQVNTLVQGTRSLYRIAKITAQDHDTRALTGQRARMLQMLVVVAGELRLDLLRFASRLQCLRWFAQIKQPCPLAFAREPMELYPPLANRLGIWQIKWEMEDLAF